MKKLYSLLFVALLTMSAWADTVVTVDFNAQGWSTNTLVENLTIDGVTLTFDKEKTRGVTVRRVRLPFMW